MDGMRYYMFQWMHNAYYSPTVYPSYRFWSIRRLKAEGGGGGHVGVGISGGYMVKMMAGCDPHYIGRILYRLKVEEMWLDQVWGRGERICGTGPHWITRPRCMVLCGIFSPWELRINIYIIISAIISLIYRAYIGGECFL